MRMIWEGSYKSKQFKDYIQKLSKANGNTYEEELKSYDERVSKIIWKERKNEEKMKKNERYIISSVPMY